jgi:hypothetical protein
MKPELTPAIQGVVETALYTDDLPRAATFYRYPGYFTQGMKTGRDSC